MPMVHKANFFTFIELPLDNLGRYVGSTMGRSLGRGLGDLLS